MPNYGAPTMQPTGNPQWDGAFGSLANAFGADPSKPAEAYYAGAKAREAQIAADRAISQSRAQPYVTGALWGQGQPAPTYSTSPIGVTMLNAPPGTSPPAAAPPPSQGLGATIAGWLPWSHTPAQAADQTANAVQQTPGPTPPPMSPPSATAPPAPTATGSNGSVVPDPGHGPFGGASFNSGGGGVIKAGPATDNGMPSPANFNMAQFHAMQVAQGVPGDQAAIQDRAVIGEWVKSGRMSQPLADSLLASYGEPTPRTTTISGETQRATTAMTQAGETGRTKLTQAGENYREQYRQGAETGRKGMDQVDITDPKTGLTTKVPLSSLQGMGGRPTLNTAQQTAGAAAVQVQPGGPGTPTTSMPTQQAQQDKVQLYETGPNTYDNFVGKDGLTHIMTAGEAAKQGLGKAPTGTDPELAGRLDAINREPNQDTKRQMLETLIDQQNRAMPLKPPDEDAANQREFLLNEQLNALIPPPSGSMNWGQNENPAGPSTELGPLQSKLAADYFNRGPPGVKGNAVEAAKAAVSQLVQQGYVNLHQSRKRGLTDAATTILRPNYTKEGKPLPEAQKFFRVDLINPNTGFPYVDPVTGEPMQDPATGKAPIDKRTGKPTTETKPPTEIPMLQKSMSSAMPLGSAAGVPDGATATMGGKAVVARGGSWYAQ